MIVAWCSTVEVGGAPVGKTSYHIKNTATFSKELKDLQVEENEIMNSHDVVSLFTIVHIKKVMEVIRKKLGRIRN